jgi:hypothetical protein
MEDKESYLEFISSENYKQEIDIWYKSHNISREKLSLFHDFVASIHDVIDNTFLGPDVMDEVENQKNHFTWAWDKVIDDFFKEKIYIKNRGPHYEYFWNFYLEAYYYSQINGYDSKIPDYFLKLFDFDHIKSKSELEILTIIYKVLNQNFKK